jgi:arginine deiminase
MKVNSNTEWGTLKEVILGRAENAQTMIPYLDCQEADILPR